MKRMYYIDNIRILLTALVVLHHLAITYAGGPGLWYYIEPNPNPITNLVLTLFIATNQSFFMGMFFLISAFFLEKSMRRKSGREVLHDKLKRLGIPLLFYIFILSPLTMYLKARFEFGLDPTFVEFFRTDGWLTFGPIWFVAALLLFTLVTVGGGLVLKVPFLKTITPLPNNRRLLLGVFFITIVSFLVRIEIPVGQTLDPFGFQLAHFTQYIVLFCVGFVASKNNWLEQITAADAKLWMRAVWVFMLVLFPAVFYFGGALTKGTDIFMGGLSWQSLAYSLWEQVVGIGIIIGLFSWYREKRNEQNGIQKTLSASAYTVYIFHTLILVGLSLAFRNVAISSTAKFLILAPIVLVSCFAISNIIRKLPVARGIL